MASYWTNFAKSGNPNGVDLPNWPNFTPANETALLIGGNIAPGMVPDEADLQAIDRLYGTARIVVKYGYALATFAAPLVLVILWQVARRLFWRRG